MAPVNTQPSEFHGRGMDLVIFCTTLLFASFFTVVGRLDSRSLLKTRFGYDDYAIFLAWINSMGLTIACCVAVYFGVGKGKNTLTEDQLRNAMLAFYAAQILYKLSINLTKASICFLYTRLFGRVKWLRITVYVVLAFVTTYAIASITATVFSCTPVQRYWDKSVDGTCINTKKFWLANAVAFVLGDAVLVVLPMHTVFNLMIPKRQKWCLALLFGLGGFVCVTSIMRATTLTPSSSPEDVTHAILASTIWTTVECNTAIICANLSMMQVPATHYLTKFLQLCRYVLNLLRRGRKGVHLPRHSESSRRLNGPSQQQDTANPHLSPTSAYSAKTIMPGSSLIGSRHGDFIVDMNTIPLGSISKTTEVEVEHHTHEATAAGDQHSMGHSNYDRHNFRNV